MVTEMPGWWVSQLGFIGLLGLVLLDKKFIIADFFLKITNDNAGLAGLMIAISCFIVALIAGLLTQRWVDGNALYREEHIRRP